MTATEAWHWFCCCSASRHGPAYLDCAAVCRVTWTARHTIVNCSNRGATQRCCTQWCHGAPPLHINHSTLFTVFDQIEIGLTRVTNKNVQFFYLVGKKEWLGIVLRVKRVTIKNTPIITTGSALMPMTG